MKARITLVVALLAGATGLAACGTSSKQQSPSGGTSAASSTSPAVATYRHALEAMNNQLASDSTGFDQCANAYNASLCVQWARHDRQIVDRAMTQLSQVSVPKQLSAGNAQVLALLRRFKRDDTALMRDIRASKSSSTEPASALNDANDLANQTVNRLFPLLHHLDPGISTPQ